MLVVGGRNCSGITGGGSHLIFLVVVDDIVVIVEVVSIDVLNFGLLLYQGC